MNAPETVTHEHAVELLPWLVNGSLDDAERTAILRHARFCLACRRELDALEEIQRAIVSNSDAQPVLAPDMRRINRRIDDLTAGRNRIDELAARLRGLLGNPWRTAFVAQAAILAIGAAVWLGGLPRQTEFTTLTRSQEFTAGDFRVVFRPQFSEAQITELIAELELDVIAGPSRRGVYTFSMAPQADRGATLAALRGNSGVLFAEPAYLRVRE